MDSVVALRTRKLSPERRQRIVEAARFLILRHGLKGATMEAIAGEARIAKPTLYGYFADRQAVYAAIIDDLLAEIRRGFAGAMAGEGDVIERIAAGLTAKYKVIARLLEGSPHADALYGEHDRLTAPQLLAVENEIETAISAALAAAGVARARQLTQLLLAGAYGVGRKARSVAELGPAIRLLTERLLRPELP